MIKYRLLTGEELEPLQEEFLKFLLVQNIYPEQWEELKKQSRQKAEDKIELFSNLVFEKILSETSFLEKIDDKRIECYHFQAESAQLIALQANENTEIDFINQPLKDVNPSHYHIYTGSKKYVADRNSEVFQVMQKGAVKSDGILYKKLALLVAESKKLP